MGAAIPALTSAQVLAEEHVLRRSAEEGRRLDRYLLVAWDGPHLAFGRHYGGSFDWEPLRPFGAPAALRVLRVLRDDGFPLMNPALLVRTVGADSSVAARLLPTLGAAVRAADRPAAARTRTASLYRAWRRLGGRSGADEPYLYALNTYLALVAKLVAALSLPAAARQMTDSDLPIHHRISLLESGALFADAGVVGMMGGNFFDWYHDDEAWSRYAADIEALIDALRPIDFAASKKSPGATRDLFKRLYLSFVPGAMRHSLGEYYTPDWLAAHALDVVGWTAEDGLLDPTAGSGTFVLEALRRRLAARPRASAAELLAGAVGLDVNPLAVLAARASLVVCLSDRLSCATPLRLPVFLADALTPAQVSDGVVHQHCPPTELGAITVSLPVGFVGSDRFFDVMARAGELLAAGVDPDSAFGAVSSEFELGYLDRPGREQVTDLMRTLAELNQRTGTEIWWAVLADRFAAGTVPPADYVIGNPPWVKWSQLPAEHADLIRNRCRELGVFSTDRWVGGIESDISTVITYQAVEKYLADRGVLAFFLTGTVFANESSQGFRRWRCPRTRTSMRVTLVEDYGALAPFDGVRNHPTLLVLSRGAATVYPVIYRIWTPAGHSSGPRGAIATAEDFRACSTSVDLQARPVPGTDAGPWLKGTELQHQVWAQLFGSQEPAYRARKGVTTDANGIFWVRAEPGAEPGTVLIANDPACGRRRELRTVRKAVEPDHLYPLLRGAGVRAFRATPDPTYRIIVPQRGMHGLPDLPEAAPRTATFLATFRAVLEQRSSFRRFQARQGAPFWSVWSTGEYTFSPFKVVWRELAGGRFQAAYVGSHHDELLGTKVVVPDHKLYFVPCDSEAEAAYLVGFLNAPMVTEAICAYAAQLSLGGSVVEYLLVPKYRAADTAHRELAAVATALTRSATAPSEQWLRRLDQLVGVVLSLPESA